MGVKEYLLIILLIGGHLRRSSSTSKSKGSFVSITESSKLVFETIGLHTNTIVEGSGKVMKQRVILSFYGLYNLF